MRRTHHALHHNKHFVKETHLCCDNFKLLRYRSIKRQRSREVAMPALAEVQLTTPHPLIPLRASERPVCRICADSMVAAEASAFVADDVVSYLWTCDTCGYGFVTKHAVKTMKCA
jgi:hypothetical protein